MIVNVLLFVKLNRGGVVMQDEKIIDLIGYIQMNVEDDKACNFLCETLNYLIDDDASFQVLVFDKYANNNFYLAYKQVLDSFMLIWEFSEALPSWNFYSLIILVMHLLGKELPKTDGDINLIKDLCAQAIP